MELTENRNCDTSATINQDTSPVRVILLSSITFSEFEMQVLD
jgi:hypothetical protein